MRAPYCTDRAGYARPPSCLHPAPPPWPSARNLRACARSVPSLNPRLPVTGLRKATPAYSLGLGDGSDDVSELGLERGTTHLSRAAQSRVGIEQAMRM